MTFRKVLSELFNWKKNPTSVFYFAIPLALLGMLFSVGYILLQGFIKHDWGYVIVFLCMTPFMGMAGIMGYRAFKLFERMHK